MINNYTYDPSFLEHYCRTLSSNKENHNEAYIVFGEADPADDGLNLNHWIKEDLLDNDIKSYLVNFVVVEFLRHTHDGGLESVKPVYNIEAMTPWQSPYFTNVNGRYVQRVCLLKMNQEKTEEYMGKYIDNWAKDRLAHDKYDYIAAHKQVFFVVEALWKKHQKSGAKSVQLGNVTLPEDITPTSVDPLAVLFYLNRMDVVELLTRYDNPRSVYLSDKFFELFSDPEKRQNFKMNMLHGGIPPTSTIKANTVAYKPKTGQFFVDGIRIMTLQATGFRRDLMDAMAETGIIQPVKTEIIWDLLQKNNHIKALDNGSRLVKRSIS